MTLQNLESIAGEKPLTRRTALKGIIGYLGTALMASSLAGQLYAQGSDRPLQEDNYPGTGSISENFSYKGQTNPITRTPSVKDIMNAYSSGITGGRASNETKQKIINRLNNSDDDYKLKAYLALKDEDEFCKRYLTPSQTKDFKELKSKIADWTKSEKLKAYDRRRKGQPYQRQPINIFKKGVSPEQITQEYSRLYPFIGNPCAGECLPLIYLNELGKGNKSRIDETIKTKKYDVPNIRIVD